MFWVVLKSAIFKLTVIGLICWTQKVRVKGITNRSLNVFVYKMVRSAKKPKKMAAILSTIGKPNTIGKQNRPPPSYSEHVQYSSPRCMCLHKTTISYLNDLWIISNLTFIPSCAHIWSALCLTKKSLSFSHFASCSFLQAV